MKRSISHLLLIICAVVFMLNGCTAYPSRRVVPTAMLQAREEIPEDELLDVGIIVFSSATLSEEEAEKQGTHPDARTAERHFIPYHLKHTLQRSSHWGAVRVLPSETDGVDLVVQGEIVEANGERLVLNLTVRDAAGTIWLRKAYKAKVTEQAYLTMRQGEKDPFQDLYNTIANDMVAFKAQLSPEEIRRIRTIAKMRFAADFSPHAFAGYLVKDRKDRYTINRLPADDDPMMDRLLRIRERVHLYEDTLNEYYDGFYTDMWPSYENWRRANLTERVALRQVKRDAYMQQTIGVLMVALAVGLGVGGVENTGALQLGMIVAGGQVIINGVNVSQQAEIHRVAIQELSDSFGSEMQPIVMEYEGKQYELSGSAEEQYERWRELLRKLYYAETGFGPSETPQ